jgi:hypothetical protein
MIFQREVDAHNSRRVHHHRIDVAMIKTQRILKEAATSQKWFDFSENIKSLTKGRGSSICNIAFDGVSVP